jgi:hypothetical protein
MEAPPSEPAETEDVQDDVEGKRELAERFRTSGPLTALDAALGDPKGQAEIMGILEGRLAATPVTKRWGELADAFGNYLGVRDSTAVEPADLLALAALDPPANLALIEELIPERRNLLAFLRLAMASHGPEILMAYEAYGELPDDWREIRPRVYHDIIMERPHIELHIEKYRGEVVFIEGGPTSILRLSRSVVRALSALPDAEAFDADSVAAFVEEVTGFVARLQERADVMAAGASDEEAAAAPAPETQASPPA